MLGLGFWELLLVLLVALIVFGPSRLPEVARTMGKAVRAFQRGVREVKDALDEVETSARSGPDHPESPESPSPATEPPGTGDVKLPAHRENDAG